mgnify:CR=1 FL=1
MQDVQAARIADFAARQALAVFNRRPAFADKHRIETRRCGRDLGRLPQNKGALAALRLHGYKRPHP